MIIKINKLYHLLFAFVLLCQLYVESYRIIIFSQILVLLFILFMDKRISVRLIKIILPLVLLFIIPFFSTFFTSHKLNFILKDLFLLIKPLIGIMIGYQMFKRINNLSDFVKTIVIVGLISAIIHFIVVIGTGGLLTGNVSQIREYGKDNFLELFALFFLAFYAKFFKESLFKNKVYTRIIFLILFFSCLLYLSRTMLILAIILLLGIYGYLRITTKTLKVISVLIAAFVLLFIYLFNTKIDRNETGLMGFLFKIKMAPSEIFVSNINREDHRELWDHWRGYEANRAFELMKENPSSFIIGNGYGSLINLKFKAPLTSDNNGLQYISEIHNGYVFIFYKIGIIGLIIFFFFITNLYIKVYNGYNFANVFIGSIAVCYFFTTLTITGIYNKRDIIIIILGGLLFFSRKSTNYRNNEV